MIRKCRKCDMATVTATPNTSRVQLCELCSEAVFVAKIAPAIRGGYADSAYRLVIQQYGWLSTPHNVPCPPVKARGYAHAKA